MSTEAVSPDAAAAFRLPRLIELEDGIIGAAFEVMKLIPASYIIERAIEDGTLREGMTVLETTSGTFGLGLAMVCATRRLPLHLVSDPAIEGYLYDRLVDLGAKISVVSEPAANGGYQAARLSLLRKIASSDERCFIPSQYDNPDNARSYGGLAEFLVDSVGPIRWIVGAVGSGGSVCGTTAGLRRAGTDVRAAGVDTHGSQLFGQTDAPRLLRGLGNSLLPANVDHRTFDEVHWVEAPMAFAATRTLHRRHALYMGPTSGAAYLVARQLAMRERSEPVVVLLPDTGHRYEATVYSDAWLKERALVVDFDETLRRGPARVNSPPSLGAGWQCIDWNRRTRDEVCRVGARPDGT